MTSARERTYACARTRKQVVATRNPRRRLTWRKETNKRHPITLSSSIPFISVISPSILSSLKKICRVRETRKVSPCCSSSLLFSPSFPPLSPQTNFPHPPLIPGPPAFPPSSPDVLWALNKKTLFSLHQAGPASKAREGEGKGKEEVGQTSLLSARLSNYFCVSTYNWLYTLGRKGRSFAIEDPPMSARGYMRNGQAPDSKSLTLDAE